MKHTFIEVNGKHVMPYKFSSDVVWFSCKISGFHVSDYEEWRLLGRHTVWLLYEPMFRQNFAPPSSG
jgi:hypothetical protein